MIEVVTIKEDGVDKTNPEFIEGKYVGKTKTGFEKVEDDEKLSELVSRGTQDIDEAIKEDIAGLSADDIKIHTDFDECCSTAIGNPRNVSPHVHVKPARQRVFDSGLKVIQMHNEKIQIDIPREILDACDELQEHVGHNEFSIVCKGSWGEDGNYVITNDYKVPKQKVEGAAVDYDLVHLEELKREGYNAVIHSHPFKSEAFSASDQETINSHFECSVLYSLRDFTTATISIVPKPGMKLIAKGDPVVEGKQSTIPKTELDNIEKKFKSYEHQWYGNAGNFHSAGKHTRFLNDEKCRCKDHEISRGLTSRVVAHARGETYTWDPVSDKFYKNGVEIDDPFYAHSVAKRFPERAGNRCVRDNQIESHQTPIRNINDRRVFTTQEPVKGLGRKDDKSKKSKGGKKENLPKIDL